jgi:hypothetical protein
LEAIAWHSALEEAAHPGGGGNGYGDDCPYGGYGGYGGGNGYGEDCLNGGYGGYGGDETFYASSWRMASKFPLLG